MLCFSSMVEKKETEKASDITTAQTESCNQSLSFLPRKCFHGTNFLLEELKYVSLGVLPQKAPLFKETYTKGSFLLQT